MEGGGWVATHDDVTELQKLNIQLENMNKLLNERGSRLQAIIDHFPGGITFLDSDLRIVVANQTAKTLLDLPDQLFSDGPPLLEDVFRFNASRGEYGPGDIDEHVATRLALARAGRPHVFERLRPCRMRTVIEVRVVPLKRQAVLSQIFTDRILTERRRSEANTSCRSPHYHDALTDLANRVLLREPAGAHFRWHAAGNRSCSLRA